MNARTVFLSCALTLAVVAVAPSPMQAAPASSALLLVSQGHDREGSGDELGALKRYHDALDLDPTCEPAYLALGTLREKRGELGEAEEVYSTGLTRIGGSIALVVARARERRVAGKLDLAATDLQTALAAVPSGEKEVPILRELLVVRRAQSQPAAELGVWRRLLAIARALDDAALTKEASVHARALSIFVGEVDPALAGKVESDRVRRALSSIARRQ